MFNQKDLQQIRSKGISIDDINQQIKHFQHGFPPADITIPAMPGKGIMQLAEGDQQHFINIYLDNAPDFRIIRFVPASGAASRMFKSLFGALEKLEGKSIEEQEQWVAEKKEIQKFFKKLDKYPFFEDMLLPEGEKPAGVLSQLLSDEGLHYGSKPKGLLKDRKSVV